ncbi:response regulator [Geothrix sp. 21YS21S-4]|uniref:response regulator n=1 Tax=Geothrix sp. 21YS21S-4 TaxID=3068889 RepID=UPI0027BA8621|nr:response regulator [Geothrix sp. 21YS21S-4]
MDDEPLTLQGLQRALRGLRHQWEMEFVSTPREAMARMEREPFDVVMTDIRMEEMEGPEFLKWVMEHHPGTVRLVLSGNLDHSSALRCVGVSHQFIAKPCNPDFLKHVLIQTSTLGDALANQAVAEFAAGIDHLPALPPLYRDVCARLEDGDAGPEELGRLVEKDPGMASAILKVVNSSYFGLRKKVVGIPDAVMHLGTEALKGLLLQTGLFQGLGRFESTPFNVNHMWAHTIHVAQTARQLSVLAGAPREVQEAAFTGGLLHDAGILVMGSRFPEEYQRVSALIQDEGLLLSSAEYEVFGVSHGEVGAYLLSMWGLPDEVIRPVVWHHLPNFESSRIFTPTVAVHLADSFSGGHAYHALFGTAKMDELYLDSIGLGEMARRWSDTFGR